MCGYTINCIIASQLLSMFFVVSVFAVLAVAAPAVCKRYKYVWSALYMFQ